MTQQIRDFHGVLKIRDRHIPGWSPNFDDEPVGWPHLSDAEWRSAHRIRCAEWKLLAVSTAAAQHILTAGYDTPPSALLELWRSCGLRIKRLDDELRRTRE